MKKTLLYFDRLHVIYQALINIHNRFGNGKKTLNIVKIGVYKDGETLLVFQY